MNHNFRRLIHVFILTLTLTCFGSIALCGDKEKLKDRISAVDNDENELYYRDHIYKENIHSALLFINGSQLSFPVIALNDQKQMELHFDDFNMQYQSYSYKFIHCNANWKPSNLVTQEYMDGFFSNFIEDYQYSFNTLFPYIHYQVKFPNEQVRFKRSGNYLLVVYANNEEEPILTKRFYVVEQKVDIKSTIHMATLARHRDYKQEVDLVINHQNYPIQDPFSELKVVITQNRRWDNIIHELKPQFIRTPELIYNYEEGNLFDAGNEYRFFDAKDLRYQSMNVDGIQIIDRKTHLFVLEEEPRSFKRYYSQVDINGNRLIKRDASNNTHVEADYMITHFTLKRASVLNNGKVYVFGALSDWEFKDEFEMNYDELNGQYKLAVPLKQGYYNYSYVFLRNGETSGDFSAIEGTHSETENDYFIFVYHRKNGEIYDRLVGFQIKNSNRSID